jgi:hypothetical protein
MSATTRYSWPTPDASDIPDVPGDMSGLANAVEESVGAIDDRVTALTGLSQTIFQYTTLTRVSTNQMTIQPGVWTPIIWDAAQYNLPKTQPGFVFASPTRITCLETGLHRFTGFAGLAAKGVGSRALAFRVNGNGGASAYPAIATGWPLLADISWYASITVDARLNKDDFVELCLRHTADDPLKMDPVLPRFGIQRLL